VKQTPIFIAKTTGVWSFALTATKEFFVQVRHVKARLMVASVVDLCRIKTRKIGILEPRSAGLSPWILRRLTPFFGLPVISHVDTPGLLWVKTVHQFAELSYFFLGATSSLSSWNTSRFSERRVSHYCFLEWRKHFLRPAVFAKRFQSRTRRKMTRSGFSFLLLMLP
jgi:hypothetical protein